MSFTSLRARLLRTFGYNKPKTVIPKTRGQAYYRSYAGGTDANLVDAISRRQPVSFFYTDKWQPEHPNTAGDWGYHLLVMNGHRPSEVEAMTLVDICDHIEAIDVRADVDEHQRRYLKRPEGY